MKKLLLLISCFFLIGEFFFSDLLGQVLPDSIKDYPGIPIISYLKQTPSEVNDNLLYKSVDFAGLYAVQVLNMKSDYLNNRFAGTKFKILPEQIDTSMNSPNSINRYTEAYYSVWEAEGVTNPNDGDATLYFNSSIGERTSDNTAVVTKRGAQEDTIISSEGSPASVLIYGPYYRQEIKYTFIDTGQFIEYTADFRLKKETFTGITPPPATDTVCQLVVTTSRIYNDSAGWHIDSTNVRTPVGITYSQLADTFTTFPVIYDYINLNPLFKKSPSRSYADYIQYKVLWKGNPSRMRLYVDNIILTDTRGMELKEEPNVVEGKINNQILANNFYGRTVGWMGVDEPQFIDQFKPIRFVQDYLISEGKSYWFAFGNSWNGKWGELIYPYGTYSMSEFDEFYKRVKKANFWSSRYLYTPYDAGYTNYGIDWRDGHIKVHVNSIFSQFLGKENVFWGPCVQGGRYQSTTSTTQLNEIGSKELLYNVNLGLLCGAKVIAIWPYFANVVDTVNPETTALVNIIYAKKDYQGTVPLRYEYTDKWKTIKDTIAPRLNGFMGRTLHNLRPDNHFLTMFASPIQTTLNNFIKSIEATGSDTCIVDLGIFKDPQDETVKYFMPLNRYYSDTAAHNLTFELQYLIGSNNWRITNYIDSTFFTLNSINGSAEFTDIIYPGDAGLYSLKPVVQYGGNITASETVPTNTTLKENVLNIKSGATLTVAGVYNIYTDIIVEEGASLNLTANSQLLFYDNARLIVNGSIINPAYGTSPVLDFNNASYSGITVNTRTNIQNLKIKNAAVGITLMDTGEGEGLPHTIKINNNIFENCELGLSVMNTPMILIQNNSFICHGGIYLSNVIEFNIISNPITCNESNPIYKLPGIELYSSSGIIRNNNISEFSIGVSLGFSTVSLGKNTIMNNFSAGLYIGTGSEADLRREAYRVPCVPGLIYYPVKGYNRIENNNNSDFLYDGAEVVINEGFIFLDQGNNRIADDRTMSFPTMTLMDGITPVEDIHAEYNDWGGLELHDRFGNLSVIYSPIGIIEPDLSINCAKLITASDNTIIDTVQGLNTVDGELSEIDLLYESANQSYIDSDYQGAEDQYKDIISQFYDNLDALLAYVDSV